MGKSQQEITLGFIGSGEVSPRNVEALLSDYMEGNGERGKFVLPAGQEFWSPGIKTVADFAIKSHTPYEIVLEKQSERAPEFREYLSRAQKAPKVVEAVSTALVKILAASENPRLVVLWDDEDATAVRAVRKAVNKGIEILDLTAGLDVLQIPGHDGPVTSLSFEEELALTIAEEMIFQVREFLTFLEEVVSGNAYAESGPHLMVQGEIIF